MRKFLKHINVVPCKCGCREKELSGTDWIEGHMCEADVLCKNCGAWRNEWAYGSYHYPDTYIGWLIHFMKEIKFKIFPNKRYELPFK